MKWKSFLPTFVLALVPFAVPAQIQIPEDGLPGYPVVGSVGLGETWGDLKVLLLTDDGEVRSETRSFRLSSRDGESRRDGFVLGIPSTTAPGRYLLAFHTVSRDRLVMTVPFEVLAKQYPRQTVFLDEELTRLLRTPDPRKTEEAIALRELLSRFDASALHQLSRFVLPVDQIRRSSEFGRVRRYQYVDGTGTVSVHTGTDFALPTGSAVRSSGRGRVVFAGTRIISGQTVIVEHLPGVYSLYYHLNRIDVEEGQMVEAGELIGTVGSTGLSTGAHLHWEMRVYGVPVDPEAFVAGVDLSPLTEEETQAAVGGS